MGGGSASGKTEEVGDSVSGKKSHILWLRTETRPKLPQESDSCTAVGEADWCYTGKMTLLGCLL